MTQVQRNLSLLLEILEAEFKLLQTDSLDTFESLQLKKQEVVESLEVSLARDGSDNVDSEIEPAVVNDPEVAELLELCRSYHIRNGMLLEKKIDINKNALNILRSSRHSDEVETYDKLGKVRNPRSVGLKSDV